MIFDACFIVNLFCRMDETEQAVVENEATEKEKEATYNIPFNMDELESLIDSALNDLDFGGMVESTFGDMKTTLNTEVGQYSQHYLYI